MNRNPSASNKTVQQILIRFTQPRETAFDKSLLVICPDTFARMACFLWRLVCGEKPTQNTEWPWPIGQIIIIHEEKFCRYFDSESEKNDALIWLRHGMTRYATNCATRCSRQRWSLPDISAYCKEATCGRHVCDAHENANIKCVWLIW